MNRKMFRSRSNMFRSITLVNLSFLTILFFTFISCQLEQLPLTDPQSDDPLKEGSYSAYIINDPALKKRWSRSKAMVYKPLGPYISFNFNIGDFNNPYLIKVHPYFGEFDPALSSIYLDDQEFPIKKTVAQGSSYIGFKNMSFQDWVNIKTNKLLLKLKLGFQEDRSFKNKTFRYAYLDKSSYEELFNWRDLQNMKEKLDGDYRLMRDITFPEPGTDGFPANGFEPVGSDANHFTGSLDGNSKTISGLYIDRPEQHNVGMFGNVGGERYIKNLTLIYKKIRGKDNVAALVGFLRGRSIVNNIKLIKASENSEIIGRWTTGGIIGHNQGGLVSNIIADVNIKSRTGGGGISGVNYGIIHGYVSGNIEWDESQTSYFIHNWITGTRFGGLTGGIGHNAKAFGYSSARVRGKSRVGGLSGDGTGQVVGYYYGDLITSKANFEFGALMGINTAFYSSLRGTVHGYWDIASSGQINSSGGGVGISSIDNVIYDEPNQAYRDTATGNEVFNNPIFTQYFYLPGRNAKWPILKSEIESFREEQKKIMNWD